MQKVVIVDRKPDCDTYTVEELARMSFVVFKTSTGTRNAIVAMLEPNAPCTYCAVRIESIGMTLAVVAAQYDSVVTFYHSRESLIIELRKAFDKSERALT